jgi:SAM-dependent methyltransferase
VGFSKGMGERKMTHPGLLGLTRRQRILKALDWVVGTALDVGCSDGAFLSAYQNSVGVDRDAQKGSAENIPFPDRSFDSVVCLDVLEHCEDQNKALSEMMRVARKRIILSFPLKGFKGHPEFIEELPVLEGFRTVHRSHNYASFRVPKKGETHFNNEKHMREAMGAWWFSTFLRLRPLMAKLLEWHGNIVKTSVFIVYDRR